MQVGDQELEEAYAIGRRFNNDEWSLLHHITPDGEGLVRLWKTPEGAYKYLKEHKQDEEGNKVIVIKKDSFCEISIN